MRGGLGLTVDGVLYTDVQTFNWPPGSPHVLAASTQYLKESTMYGFVSWSNSVTAPAQTINTPETATTYTATYTALTYVTVATDPVGLVFEVDGSLYTTTQTFYWWTNSTHWLSTNPIQTRAGANYSFAGWSNTGPLSQNVIAPYSAASYTATFTAVRSSATLSLTGGSGPSLAGQAVTLTVTVGPASPELQPGTCSSQKAGRC
jgi:hypothetical protein